MYSSVYSTAKFSHFSDGGGRSGGVRDEIEKIFPRAAAFHLKEPIRKDSLGIWTQSSLEIASLNNKEIFITGSYNKRWTNKWIAIAIWKSTVVTISLAWFQIWNEWMYIGVAGFVCILMMCKMGSVYKAQNERRRCIWVPLITLVHSLLIVFLSLSSLYKQWGFQIFSLIFICNSS